MPNDIQKGQHPPVEPPDVERENERRRQDDAAKQADPQPGGGRHSESEKPNSPDSRWGSNSPR
jgi:hypothetical protein